MLIFVCLFPLNSVFLGRREAQEGWTEIWNVAFDKSFVCLEMIKQIVPKAVLVKHFCIT
jgi:hypothetical protein